MTSLLTLQQHGTFDESHLVSKYYMLPKSEAKSVTPEAAESGQDLVKRIESLESTLFPVGPTPGPNMSASVASVFQNVCQSGCYSARFKWVEKEYYTWELAQRAKKLGAPSLGQLTKSMLMENVRHKGESTRVNSKFYLVVVQYIATIDAKKLAEKVRTLPPVRERLGGKDFEFRVASEEDNDKLTGFSHNSVSPFGLKTSVPIIISKAIVDGGFNFMWMGGGDVDLKLGMGVEEFIKAKDAFVLDVSDKRVM